MTLLSVIGGLSELIEPGWDDLVEVADVAASVLWSISQRIWVIAMALVNTLTETASLLGGHCVASCLPIS